MKNERPFANSAFLACAYSVYLYGTTSWRLSSEFNNLLPSLPNMARKLLGLKKIKEEDLRRLRASASALTRAIHRHTVDEIGFAASSGGSQ